MVTYFPSGFFPAQALLHAAITGTFPCFLVADFVVAVTVGESPVTCLLLGGVATATIGVDPLPSTARTGFLFAGDDNFLPARLVEGLNHRVK